MAKAFISHPGSSRKSSMQNVERGRKECTQVGLYNRVMMHAVRTVAAIVFTRDSICAIAHICYGNSVHPSVCLSHGWISQKMVERSFHHTIASSL